jgi:hypothetical protein
MSESAINKYQNGKIYKIFNTLNDEIYVGSTIQSLSHRMIKHKDDVKNDTKDYHTTISKLMKELGVEHFYIELLELYPCDNKGELSAREGYWIKEIGTINKHVMGRTRKQHYEDNKIAIQAKSKEYNKQYRIDNKEKILAQSKEYRERTKEQQADRQKQEKVKAWRNTKVECPCGGSYTNCHKAEHLKSMRHLEYENLTTDPELAEVKAAEAALKDKERMESSKIQQKEYRTRNKEEISKQKKEYYEDNKDVITTYKKEWYEKNKETVIARVKANNEANRDQKLEYYKQRYEDKKESLSIKVDCPCGGCYSVMSKNKHMRTAKHKKYEEELNE